MTPTTFHDACLAIGMSPASVAQACGRAARTGHDWATGRHAIPAPVVAWLARQVAARQADPAPVLPRHVPVPPKKGVDTQR